MGTKHTPGPWEDCPDFYNGGDHYIWPVGANGVQIATVHDNSQVDANAAFIVRACNAHEELVEALRELIDQLEGIGIPDWHGAEGLDLSQARAAIKKAEGV